MIALPLVVLTAVGFAALRLLNHLLQPAALTFAASAAIGIAAGFTSRLTLPSRSPWLRLILAASTTVTGLVVLALITQSETGLVLIRASESMVRESLGQLMVGFSAAFLALRAWRRSAVSIPERLSSTTRRSSRRSAKRGPARGQLARRPVPHRTRPSSRLPLLSLPNLARLRSKWPALPHYKLQRPALPQFHFPRLVVQNLRIRPWACLRSRLAAISPMPWQRSRSAEGYRPALRLSAQEEHRCPYCLDIVENNDARGIHVCPICHSWHHSDCWSITGTCQVPHHRA